MNECMPLTVWPTQSSPMALLIAERPIEYVKPIFIDPYVDFVLESTSGHRQLNPFSTTLQYALIE